jgi:hypothetical protein
MLAPRSCPKACRVTLGSLFPECYASWASRLPHASCRPLGRLVTAATSVLWTKNRYSDGPTTVVSSRPTFSSHFIVCIRFSGIGQHASEMNCRKLDPSWEADSRSACEECSRLLWVPKAHCQMCKSPPLGLGISQLKLFCITPYFLAGIIHVKIILRFTPTSAMWSLPFKLSD